MTYPSTLRVVPIQWSPFAFITGFRFRYGFLSKGSDVEVGILPPTEAAIVTQNVGWKPLGCFPPHVRFSSATSATAGMCLGNIFDDRAFVIVGRLSSRWGTLRYRQSRLSGSLDPAVLFSKFHTEQKHSDIRKHRGKKKRQNTYFFQ